MPIYAYRCESCGHAKDVLRKVSDPVLSTCPACGAESFKKQLTAAGFQLKGSGWYVTDFRGNGNGATQSDSKTESKPDAPKSEPAAPAASGTTTAASSSSGGDGPASGGCGSACACH
jgi:putative FmdB family regulatory protein